ncbi:hypothetical protein predicted by Glimmer/Critica [Acetobacter ghanensis]|uniref:Uncharacterized protein n=1 Tax=Acetobacter ghanensis TaxID=431306 RepID=A0A0U5BLX2_9PROT|nr:hypothetical protein predicted by Glimmer/Critica [Acetobacter ghanensis]
METHSINHENVKNKAEDKTFVNEERKILLVSQELEKCQNATRSCFPKGTFA